MTQEQPQPPQPDFSAAFRRTADAVLPPPPDPRTLARRALKRNARLTHLLAVLCLLFWLLGCTGMIIHVLALNRLVIFLRISPGLPWSYSPRLPGETLNASDYMFWGTNLIHHSTPYVVASLICLMLAAICTVTLILASRRATLHRIHLTLTELSEQLKRVSPPTADSSVLQINNPQPGPTGPEERKGSVMRSLLILSFSLLSLTGAAVGISTVCADTPHPTTAASRPWQGYPILSPFSAVRYPTPTTIEVQVSDTWYQLLAFNDLPTPDLIAACQSLDHRDWQKRFEEDLIEVLTRTGHTPPSPNTADLRLKDLSTNQEQTLKSVPMTEANRWKLWKARNQPAGSGNPKSENRK